MMAWERSRKTSAKTECRWVKRVLPIVSRTMPKIGAANRATLLPAQSAESGCLLKGLMAGGFQDCGFLVLTPDFDLPSLIDSA